MRTFDSSRIMNPFSFTEHTTSFTMLRSHRLFWQLTQHRAMPLVYSTGFYDITPPPKKKKNFPNSHHTPGSLTQLHPVVGQNETCILMLNEFLCPRPMVAGIKRCCDPSVCPSVPFYDSVLFARWRYASVAVSNAFEWGQHGRLCPHPNAISGGISLRRAIPSTSDMDTRTKIGLFKAKNTNKLTKIKHNI